MTFASSYCREAEYVVALIRAMSREGVAADAPFAPYTLPPKVRHARTGWHAARLAL